MPLGAARFGLLGGVADLGKLELIETQTASADSSLDFTDLGSYNVHLMTFNNINGSANASLNSQLSNNGGSSYIASGYEYAFFRLSVGGSALDSNSTSHTSLNMGAIIGTNAVDNGNGYIYFYNLTDSSKYSYITFHTFSHQTANASSPRTTFGSANYPTAETHNAIRFIANTGTIDGTVSLYGIAES